MEALTTKTKRAKSDWIMLLLILSLTAQTFGQLNGTYTIGGIGSNYSTITEAVTDLNNLGVGGPVVFVINTGTYDEQITIGEYSGSSCENTVVFKSATEDYSSVIIRHTFSQDNDYVIKMDGADGVTFKGITIKKDLNFFGNLIEVSNGSDCLTIENSYLKGGNSKDNLIHSLANTSDNNDQHLYANNTFDTGNFGIYKQGFSTITYESELNTNIENNIFRNLNYGVVVDKQRAVTVVNNSISATNGCVLVSNTFGGTRIEKNVLQVSRGDGIRLESGSGSGHHIRKNRILVTDSDRNYGIDFRIPGRAGYPNSITNNFVTVKGTSSLRGYGINIQSNYINIFYNSIMVNGSNVGASISSNYVYVRNNIFSSYGS